MNHNLFRNLNIPSDRLLEIPVLLVTNRLHRRRLLLPVNNGMQWLLELMQQCLSALFSNQVRHLGK